jgi:hypothetical protein
VPASLPMISANSPHNCAFAPGSARDSDDC